jgi:predicted lipoprotein with Yx(FWY)xxD motif
MKKYGIALIAVALALSGAASAADDFVKVDMPAGFSVQPTELEGPVFANSKGRTLYVWPFARMRNGLTGDAKGKSNCGSKVLTETAGLASPWPPGLLLPDLETRPACTEMWIPELASADAKPVGEWSLITREDGNKQWAYNEQAVYT